MDDLLNTAPCGYFSFTDDGTLVTVNATLLVWLGYSPEEMTGQSISTFLPVSSRIFYQTHFFPLLKMHGVAEEIYLPLHTKEKVVLPVLLNAVRREREGVLYNDCVCIPMHQRNQYEDELLKAKKALQKSEAFVRRVADSLVAFVGVLTPDGVLIEANQTALAAANLQLEDVLGKPFEETYWWAYSASGQQQLREAIQQAASGECVRYDVEVRLAERVRITIDFSLVPLFDSDGKVEYLIPSGVNITDRKIQEKQLNASREWLSDANRMLEMQVHLVHEQAAELESQKAALEATNQKLEEANALLEALSITDGLTGLLNHRAFQEHLGKEWERSLRSRQPFSVILMDVDKFKTYNDAFGHPEGDEVLKKVAFLLKETARTVDFVCRYGGEEFVILLPNTDVQGSMAAAERFRRAIEGHPWALRPITASFGAATFQSDYETAQAMVEAADKALYRSKNCGRNQVTHAALETSLSTIPASF